MSKKLRAGDKVLYRSRKNGKMYIGYYGLKWADRFGRVCVSIYDSKYSKEKIPTQIANPFIDDVQLLTDELYMLYKLENL